MEKLLIKKWMMSFVLVACFSVSAFAQSILVTGIVTSSENGEPLVGANVMVKGTSIGTVTDTHGRYTLVVPRDTFLVISYIGYKTEEVRVVKKEHNVELQLEGEVSRLFFTILQRKLFYERMIPLKDDMDYCELLA